MLASQVAGLRPVGGPGLRRAAVSADSLATRSIWRLRNAHDSAAAGRQSDRDQLVIEHVGLVKALAQRLAQRLPSQVEMNELISVGVLGLIDAAGRYKPALGVPFDAFARRRVQGAMLDALRELDWAPRSLRRMRRDVDSAIATAAPRAAARAERGRDRRRAVDDARPSTSKSLEQMRTLELGAIRQLDATGEDGTPLLELCLDPGRRARRAARAHRAARACWPAPSASCPSASAQILALYYEEELTLAEIGEVIGVVRVARVAAALAGAVAPAHACCASRSASAELQAMSKILSQEEIDALLDVGVRSRSARRAPRSQRRSRESVVVYNFRRPDRVSKEQMRSLHFLHDRFARNVVDVAVGLPARR